MHPCVPPFDDLLLSPPGKGRKGAQGEMQVSLLLSGKRTAAEREIAPAP